LEFWLTQITVEFLDDLWLEWRLLGEFFFIITGFDDQINVFEFNWKFR